MSDFEYNEGQRKLTPQEEAQVRKATTILYVVMILFIAAPFIAWYFLKS